MLKITFYHNKSENVFCSEIAKKLSFAEFEIALSDNIVSIESDLLFIFCSNNLVLSSSALSYINSRNVEANTNIIPITFEESYCPEILKFFNKIKTRHGDNIQTARKIINYIVYRVLHKRSPDLESITVKIHDLSNENFLGNGTIISPYGDIVTSGEVLRRIKKPLASIVEKQIRYEIKFPSFNAMFEAYVDSYYEDKAPFEIALLKLCDNTSFSKGDHSYASLLPYSRIINSKISSFSWNQISYNEIDGEIIDIDNYIDNSYIKKFAIKRLIGGISPNYCGSPILSEDNYCVLGIIVLVKPLNESSTNYAICCTTDLLKNEFGINTIFSLSLKHDIPSDAIHEKSQRVRSTNINKKYISQENIDLLKNINQAEISVKSEVLTKKPIVFLCHAKEDIKKVKNLYNKLHNDGINIWLDEKKIKPGEEWELSIAKAIDKSSKAIVCLSKKSTVKEGYVQKEIKSCLEKSDKMPEGTNYIIPIRFDPCEVPYSLKKYHYIDYPKDYEKLIDELKKI